MVKLLYTVQAKTSCYLFKLSEAIDPFISIRRGFPLFYSSEFCQINNYERGIFQCLKVNFKATEHYIILETHILGKRINICGREGSILHKVYYWVLMGKKPSSHSL